MIKIKDSNNEYHSHEQLSASALKKIYASSVRQWLKVKQLPTKAMGFGTAVHTALLEPDLFDKEIAVKPANIDRRTKAGKELYNEFVEKSKGLTIIDSDELALIEAIKVEVDNNEYIKPYLQGEKELSHYGNFEGVGFRCRPDVVNYDKGFIVDVKTCQDTHPAAFTRDVYKWGYHLQAAVYSDFLGLDAAAFRFIVIMSKMVKAEDGSMIPFADVQLMALDNKVIEQGREAYKQAISKYVFYKEQGFDNVISWKYIANDEAYIVKGYGRN
jgi:exodeoxyribonuclease VIII